jgi:predicted O-methyltransferase YrrM
MKSVEYFKNYILAFHKLVPHLAKIQSIIKSFDGYPEGNLFMHDKSYLYDSRLLTKQVNMYRIGCNANNIVEIGFNAGHSALVFLIANPNSKLVIFDVGWHPYTRPCFEYLDSVFPGRMTFIEGDSLETMSNFSTDVVFDVAHIDGAHDHTHFISDLIHVSKITNSASIVILDDAMCHPLDIIVDMFEQKQQLERLTNYEDTDLYPHVIVRMT